MTRHYRRDGTPYPEGDDGLFEWARDLEKPEMQIVRQDNLPNGYWVSTVWLGLNHRFLGEGPPLIFETMVRNPQGKTEDWRKRYATENDAILGHMEAVSKFQSK